MGWLRRKADLRVLRPGGNLPVIHGGTGADLVDGSVQGRAFLDRLLGPNDPLYPDPTFASNADKGFDKNELVYACIMEKATSLPEAPFRVYGADGMGLPRESHPLRELIANPNPSCTEFELMELTSIYMDLAGIAFWEVVTDRIGRPVELWPLRPDMVRIFPRQDGRHEYGYYLGNGRIINLGTNVLAFKYPNPTDPLLGQAPMRAANRAVALDNEATDFVKALLQNRAVPGTVITTEQRIDEATTDRLTERWIERFGKANRGAPAFLQKGMEVHTLGLDLGELEFPDLRTISESRICMSFGVPPILVGAKVGLDRSTFANYAEARKSLWEETLMPLQKRLAGVIVQKLLPMVEQGQGPRPRRVSCRFDNSEVLALKESEANRWEKGTQALRAGGLLVNDFRRYVGLPPVPGGDVFLIPAGVVPVEDPSKVPAQAPALPAAEPPAAEDEPPADEQAPASGDEPKRLVLEAKAERDPLAKAVAAVVAEQRAEVMAQIDGAKALLTLAPDRFKAEVWTRRRWNRKLAEALEPHMRAHARAGARSVDGDQPLEVMDNYIHVTAEKTAERWNDETAGAVLAAVALGGKDVVANVDHAFVLAAGYRADLLASSVSTELRSFGKVDTAKRVGMTTKTWVGGRRPTHASVNGQTVPIGSPFSNGMHWPGGPNCKCDVVFDRTGNL